MDTLCLKTPFETHRSFCTADIIQILDLVSVQRLKTAWPSWSSSQSSEKKWVSNWSNSPPSLRWDGRELQRSSLVRGLSFDSSLEVVYLNFLECWVPLDGGSQRGWRMTTGLEFFLRGGGGGGQNSLFWGVIRELCGLPSTGCFDPAFRSLFPHLGAGRNIKGVGAWNSLNARELQ